MIFDELPKPGPIFTTLSKSKTEDFFFSSSKNNVYYKNSLSYKIRQNVMHLNLLKWNTALLTAKQNTLYKNT